MDSSTSIESFWCPLCYFSWFIRGTNYISTTFIEMDFIPVDSVWKAEKQQKKIVNFLDHT